ncbi:HAMP domain-containing histidine kinase [Campylobacter hepaticus]|uniref:histidine kinase n=3 Tax=Campylobacter hepaticus TaxID=1813019 RepID=A0A6I1PM53_9BACT|nr:HAMP domain-containing sensor histidine kinase [Campylobacter hepaticus]AXP08585.1 sensor histidine kinase [Campylobacter hepaticus]MCZ0772426.1 HAMP domain-containing histidine kinase [Campylobacter hepaticus]MCZ0773894.1 HAMP domain-containing histidine kinase [Campylobacter hepaticus]MCZ0775145.1 HAMP domain-containing histidine kinase [Campylobacter hepaticus]MDX2323351.1 HAMP domain-containing sensor histidine kinase [Campylobacter hepaticus]
MLKTKNVFIIFFILLTLIFTSAFYIFTDSYLDFLLLKQYEQKIKSLDDVLKFSLLPHLNNTNIEKFAKDTRADFIIFKKDTNISSVKNPDLFLKLKEEKILNFNSQKILIKSFIYKDYKYIIIVYPRFGNLELFLLSIAMNFGICILFICILMVLLGKKITTSFNKILDFLDSINSHKIVKLEKGIFKEFGLLNDKLLKTKEKILKNTQKNKKQDDKIALKNIQLASMISAISHELKNPLSVIDLSLEMLKDPNLKDETLKIELLEKISRQSVKLNTLTHKLNLVFNLNSEALQMQEFDLFSLCEKIIKNPGFERVILQGESTKVQADEFLIEQVIINLLSNALKYSQKEVILIAKNQKITVQDFGKGIQKDKLKFITKKFYKIDVKSDTSFGLGLFLVKKILSIHKSYLEISSTLGYGSSFSFKLNQG